MRPYHKYTFVLLSSTCLLLSACGMAPRADRNSNGSQAPAGQQSGANAANDNVTAEPQAAKSSLPQSKTLDLQANHANGSVLRVTKVDFADDSITLEFAVTNGYRQAIKLAQGRMQLRDDVGSVYNLSPPAANPDIEVAPSSSLKGKLTFLGRIAPAAKSLTLTTNYQYSSYTGAYDTTPYMVIGNIPVER